MMAMRFLGVLAWSICVTSQSMQFCDKGTHPSDLPRCTHSCLDNQQNDGTCASNLFGFCQLSSGFSSFFLLWGDCLKDQCNNDDKYHIMDEWKRACKGAVHEEDLTTADIGDWRGYMAKMAPTSAPDATSTTPTSPVSSIPQTSKEDEKTTATPTPTSAPQSESNPATSNAPPPPERTSSKDEPASQAPALLSSPNPSDTTLSTLSRTTQATDLASPSSSSSFPAPASPPTSSTPTIAGAAAGGTAFLALALGVAFYLLRRRKRAQSQASTAQHWNPDAGVGRPTLPDVGGVYEKEGDGLERYAHPTPVGYQQQSVQQLAMQHGSSHHAASTDRVKINSSPYPEWSALHHKLDIARHELESSQAHVSPQQGWNGPSEVHAESRSPVSELEGMGPIVRMEGGRGRYYASTNLQSN